MITGEFSITEPEHQESESNPEVESGTSEAAPNPNLDNQNIEHSRNLALAAARVASENGGRDIKVLDMTEHTPMFDFFVIASGSSRRQLHAMSEEIDHKLEDDLKDRRLNIDGYDESRWIVLDYATVVIHLFDDETRAYYSLESLWADARELDLTGIIEEE